MKKHSKSRIERLLRKSLLFQKGHSYNFGLIPDKEDSRDYVYRGQGPVVLPETTNRKNLALFPWRYDQLHIGACVGNGVAEAFRHVLMVNCMADFEPSRLFAYFISRKDKENDTGASIRDAFKAINTIGLCSEQAWPYHTQKYADVPPPEAWKEAELHQSIRYAVVPQVKETIKEVLYQGYPIVYGKAVYESFMSDEVARTGIVKKPRRCLEESHGWHCQVMFDYDKDGVIELNSWGSEWGQCGVDHIPWDYVLNRKLCRDLWTIYLTE